MGDNFGDEMALNKARAETGIAIYMGLKCINWSASEYRRVSSLSIAVEIRAKAHTLHT